MTTQLISFKINSQLRDKISSRPCSLPTTVLIVIEEDVSQPNYKIKFMAQVAGVVVRDRGFLSHLTFNRTINSFYGNTRLEKKEIRPLTVL